MGGQHAPTYVVDAWLQLLQQSQQAVGILRAVPGALQREAITAGVAFLSLINQLLEHWKVTPGSQLLFVPAWVLHQILASKHCLVVLLLLVQPRCVSLPMAHIDKEPAMFMHVPGVVIHWLLTVQVLSPAVQPRALWLAARHVPLRAALDGQWAALMKALTDALSGNEEAVRRRRCSVHAPVTLPWAPLHLP